MSMRTIIEINHDYLHDWDEFERLLDYLKGSGIAYMLNKSGGKPVRWGCGIVVIAQRHHSETITFKVE